MMFDPLAWIDEELAELDAHDLRRRLQTRGGAQGVTIGLGDRPLLNFGANDYLALAADTRLVRAAALAAQAEGLGSGASALIVGRSAAHEQLETRLAQLKQTAAALVFPSGYAANVGTIAALVGRNDAVFSDALNHASIIDGCRLARAEVHVYRHRDVAHLDQLLRDTPVVGRRLVVTDTVFSMDGDLAPLADIAEVAAQQRAMLMVDEAHATGVFGPRGSGLVETLGVEAGVHIRLGTLSKALGSAGGFVCGERRLIDWLLNRARSYVFSTAPPPALCAAALAALDIVRDEPWRREQLLARADHLRERLREQGWNVGSSASQIVPIIVGTPRRALDLSAYLRTAGIFVPAIRPPSVPADGSLLRISLSYAHDDRAIETLLAALRATRE